MREFVDGIFREVVQSVSKFLDQESVVEPGRGSSANDAQGVVPSPVEGRDDQRAGADSSDGPVPIPSPIPAPTGSGAGGEPSSRVPKILEQLEAARADVAALGESIRSIAQQRDLELKMYDDLREHRAGDDVVRSMQLYRGLIHVLDRIEEFKGGDHKAADVLDSIQDELLEVLERQGISQIEGSKIAFDPTKQRAIGNLEAEASETIRVVRAGFEYEGKVIRPESVLVREHPEVLTAPDSGDDTIREGVPR